MRAHTLSMLCLRLVSMLQMMTKYLLGWEMWMWKKFKLVYKKPLPKPKSLGKGGKNVSGLVLKAGCDIKN